MQRRAIALLSVAVFALLVAPLADASMVQKMDLAEMCKNADRIFRGRVLSVETGTMEVGGAELPTVTYRMEVTDAIQGEFNRKGDRAFTEVTMLGHIKDKPNGTIRRFSKLPDLPAMVTGSEYLLVLTPNSSIGLTMTVGIGQGCFAVVQDSKGYSAVNELGNAGLSNTINGPVSYDHLASEIRSLIGQ